MSFRFLLVVVLVLVVLVLLIIIVVVLGNMGLPSHFCASRWQYFSSFRKLLEYSKFWFKEVNHTKYGNRGRDFIHLRQTLKNVPL